MPLTLVQHFALLEDEYAQALMVPLSARQALLVAVLLDRYADRVFAAYRTGAPEQLGLAEDVLAWRKAVRTACPALGLVFDLCGQAPDAPRLVTRSVTVPIADYPALRVEDFMVSLYNAHTVQRVLIVSADGATRLAHEVFAEALAAVRRWPRG